MVVLTLVALGSALAAGIASDAEGARVAAIVAGAAALATTLATAFVTLTMMRLMQSREDTIRRYGATMSLRSGDLYLEVGGPSDDLPAQVEQLVQTLRERLVVDEIAQALGDDEEFHSSMSQLAREVESGITREYGSLEERSLPAG
jgi:NADH:ubiquinone oxidoreductase subunit D